MAYRKRESRKARKRFFGRNAMKTHRKNVPGGAMRGGIRL